MKIYRFFQFTGAKVSPTTGKRFTITNVAWWFKLEKTDKIDVMFVMSYRGNRRPSISSLSLNGRKSCFTGGVPLLAYPFPGQSKVLKVPTKTYLF